MGKKKGNLRAALASHTSKQEKRTKEAAARLAHERKVASMGQGKAERSKIKKQKREAEAGAGAGAGAGADAQTSTGLDGAGRFSALQKGKEKQRDEEDGDGPAGQDLDTAKNGNGAVRFVQGIEGVSARKGKKKLVNPLQRDDTILLVGEGQ